MQGKALHRQRATPAFIERIREARFIERTPMSHAGKNIRIPGLEFAEVENRQRKKQWAFPDLNGAC